MLCPRDEIIGSIGREKGFDCGFTRSSKVALATQIIGQRLVSFSLFTSYKTPMRWNKGLDMFVEACVEFVQELFTFAPAFPFGIKRVVGHDHIEHQNVARES